MAPDLPEIQSKIEKLRQEIDHHNYPYYVLDSNSAMQNMISFFTAFKNWKLTSAIHLPDWPTSGSEPRPPRLLPSPASLPHALISRRRQNHEELGAWQPHKQLDTIKNSTCL
jgi:hypothetical protein